jgi:hypothetical protein
MARPLGDLIGHERQRNVYIPAVPVMRSHRKASEDLDVDIDWNAGVFQASKELKWLRARGD